MDYQQSERILYNGHRCKSCVALPRNGYYDVSLIVTAANGCTDRTDKPLYIWIGPDQMNPAADKTEGCIPLKVHFNANLTNNWTPRSITWNFRRWHNGYGSQSRSHIHHNRGFLCKSESTV